VLGIEANACVTGLNQLTNPSSPIRQSAWPRTDEVTFSMFIEVFRYLPLATIIESQVRVKISCSAYVGLTLLVFDRSVCTFTYNRISTHMRARTHNARTQTCECIHTRERTHPHLNHIHPCPQTHTPMLNRLLIPALFPPPQQLGDCLARRPF